jgi:hypothetical protein
VAPVRSGRRADQLQSLAEGEFMANLKGLASIPFAQTLDTILAVTPPALEQIILRWVLYE